jgi:hypothetical protein
MNFQMDLHVHQPVSGCHFVTLFPAIRMIFSWLIVWLFFDVFQGVNEMKVLTNAQLANLLVNLAQYLDCIVLESSSPAWISILSQFDVFFRRLLSMLNTGTYSIDSVLKIMIHVLKTPGLTSYKVCTLIGLLPCYINSHGLFLTLFSFVIHQTLTYFTARVNQCALHQSDHEKPEVCVTAMN